jgi:hypothetical protein
MLRLLRNIPLQFQWLLSDPGAGEAMRDALARKMLHEAAEG